jgi:hypothetical protein
MKASAAVVKVPTKGQPSSNVSITSIIFREGGPREIADNFGHQPHH